MDNLRRKFVGKGGSEFVRIIVDVGRFVRI